MVNMRIVKCEMSGKQLDKYKEVEGSFGSFESVGINVSNIVFPQNPERDTATYSQEGFVQSFIRNHTHKNLNLCHIIITLRFSIF